MKFHLNVLLFFLLMTFVAQPLLADEEEPLFSGTLLSFYSENTEPGEYAIQPYFVWARIYGFYDQNSIFQGGPNIHQYDVTLSLETGLVKGIDVNLVMSALYTHTDEGDSVSYGDTQLYFGFQIMKEQKKSWIPSVRILIGQSFPTGKYQDLDPELQGGDASGTGAYEISLIFVTSKTFFKPKHPIRCTFNAFFGLSNKVNVKGVNFYGKTQSIHGIVRPGNQSFVNFALEYLLSTHWEVGIDLRYVHQDSSTFRNKSDQPQLTQIPSSESMSIAPCISYNFNENLCIVGGVWFSVGGRNTSAFTSGVLTVLYGF